MKIQSPAARVLVRPAGLVVIQPVSAIGAASKRVKPVAAPVLGVHENRIVLAAEPARGDAAGAIVPDDLVQEVLRSKQVVQHQSEMMHGAPIGMQVKRAVFGEQSSALFKPRLHESEVAAQAVGPAVVVTGLARVRCRRLAVLLSRGMATGRRPARLVREEGRVKVNEIAAAIGQSLHDGEVLAGLNRVWGDGVGAAAGSSRHQSKCA